MTNAYDDAYDCDLSDADLESLAAWEADALAEYEHYDEPAQPVRQRYDAAAYVSTSKGMRNGKRRYRRPREVELVNDRDKPPGDRWTKFARYAWDDAVAEVYGREELGLDEQLESEVRRLAYEKRRRER